MARIFLVLAVVLGFFWWLRRRAEARLRAERRAARPDPAPRGGEAMVQCAQCGVHVPLSEAIAYRGLHYCRRSHLPDDSGPAA